MLGRRVVFRLLARLLHYAAQAPSWTHLPLPKPLPAHPPSSVIPCARVFTFHTAKPAQGFDRLARRGLAEVFCEQEHRCIATRNIQAASSAFFSAFSVATSASLISLVIFPIAIVWP